MKRKRLLILAGVALLLVAACPLAVGLLGLVLGDAPSPGAANVADDAATAEAFLSGVTRAARPTATYTVIGGLVVAVNEGLGESNRGTNNGRQMTGVDWREGEPVVRVVWAVDDNFAGLRLAGALGDVAAILRAVDGAGVAYEAIEVSGTFALADGAGRVTEREVISARFTRAAVAAADWDALSPMDVLTLAETYWTHPELE